MLGIRTMPLHTATLGANYRMGAILYFSYFTRRRVSLAEIARLFLSCHAPPVSFEVFQGHYYQPSHDIELRQPSLHTAGRISTPYIATFG